MGEVAETLLLALFLWLILWLVARPRRKYRLRKAYQAKLNSPRWIRFSAHLRYGKACFRCYTRRRLTVHHVDYLHDQYGYMLEPWDPAYLERNLLLVVCWKCHRKERPPQWLLHP